MNPNTQLQRAGLALEQGPDGVRLASLFGLPCPEEVPAPAGGWFDLATPQGPIRPDDWTPAHPEFNAETVRLGWTCRQGLAAQSEWSLDDASGVVTRQDRLVNRTETPIELRRCLSRFVLDGGDYRYYAQASRWCHESQGSWQDLRGGRVVLTCEGGRTTQGSAPLLGLSRTDSPGGMTMHVLPVGNWTIRLTTHTVMAGSVLTIDAGLGEEHLRLLLQPGEAFDLPALLLQPLPEPRIETIAPAVHARLVPDHAAADAPPLVYNTWFDRFDELKTTRLDDQLQAAAKVGCEVFVVDAGWYGQSEGNWAGQCGDWREKHNGAFGGAMGDFAQQVRQAGLGFGLWVEPERLCRNVPTAREHPEWLARSDSGQFYPDLQQRPAREWTAELLARLIETYELGWVKVDFNHLIGPDPAGRELHDYYAAWYDLLDSLRQRFPRTHLEGCASGGMRLDANTAWHFDSHFLSDTVEPVDVLRIGQGTLLRLPPGRLGRWAVFRPDTPGERTVQVPGGATWDQARSFDLSFVLRGAMCGCLGLSGDLAGLDDPQTQTLAEHLAWYKDHRSVLLDSCAHLLTPPRPIKDRAGWAALQLAPCPGTEQFLFVYRLAQTAPTFRLWPAALQPETSYALQSIDAGQAPRVQSGNDWMQQGLDVTLPAPFNATILTLQPQP